MDDWEAVFRDRGALELDLEYLQRWKAHYSSLVDYCRKYFESELVVEFGQGVGRHSALLASSGFQVIGLEADASVARAAKENLAGLGLGARVETICEDFQNIPPSTITWSNVSGIVHGGVMEHFTTREAIVAELERQLSLTSTMVFDVPILTRHNASMFSRDSIFRHVWDADIWISVCGSVGDVLAAAKSPTSDPGMTDDVIIALQRRRN